MWDRKLEHLKEQLGSLEHSMSDLDPDLRVIFEFYPILDVFLHNCYWIKLSTNSMQCDYNMIGQ